MQTRMSDVSVFVCSLYFSLSEAKRYSVMMENTTSSMEAKFGKQADDDMIYADKSASSITHSLSLSLSLSLLDLDSLPLGSVMVGLLTFLLCLLRLLSRTQKLAR